MDWCAKSSGYLETRFLETRGNESARNTLYIASVALVAACRE